MGRVRGFALMKRVLVLNSGSSTLKWSVLAADRETVGGGNERWTSDDAASRVEQIQAVLRRAPAFDVAGHRLVHGGTRFREAARIDDGVRRDLAALAELAPEHMNAALAGIDAVAEDFPNVPQVAVFDTAFHATLSEAASVYGLPFEWTERWGLRRFGFHGLSVAYAVERARELVGEMPSRMIVCHLGSGCSLTAVEKGKSIDTTMGFSPLEGPMMATRSGSIDPGLLLHLLERCGIDPGELRETLTGRSGLLGVSGVSRDVRQVLEALANGSARARLAYEIFVLSIRRALGAMAAVLGGVDAIVFTGGIGENSSRVRQDTVRALEFAGVDLDNESNSSGESDRDIAKSSSSSRVLVIRSREDLVILSEALRVETGTGADSLP